MKNVLLKSGTFIPNIGYGTFKTSKIDAMNSVSDAIYLGYRHIDCAAVYGNEKEVGLGIGLGLTRLRLERKDLFITSKLWNSVRGYDETIEAFNQTLSDLRLDYIDLYLIHWPVPNVYKSNYKLKNAESFRAIEDLVKAGKIISIGVSNFKIHHIEELKETSTLPISVNQIEFHLNCVQDELVKYCHDNDIVVEGYTTLANGDVFKSSKLKEIAEKYHTSIANICTAFSIQKGVIPLVKSTHKERMIENLKMDFIISPLDMKELENIKGIRPLQFDSDDIEF